MKKRTLLLLATTLLLSTGGSLVHAQQAATVASDLNGHFAKESVVHLEEKGILQVQQQGLFSPNGNVDRAEFKQWISKALGFTVQDTTDLASTVSRIEAAQWVSDAVPVLVKQPNTKLMSINPYDDLEQIENEQRPAVFKLYGLGIMKGDGQRHFYPSQALTRGEAAVMLDKAMTFMKQSAIN